MTDLFAAWNIKYRHSPNKLEQFSQLVSAFKYNAAHCHYELLVASGLPIPPFVQHRATQWYVFQKQIKP
jgi:hypothetical protein